MKRSIIIAVLVATIGTSFKGTAQTVQYVTLQSGSNLPVQTNQLVSVIGYDWAHVTIANSYPAGYYASKPTIGGYLGNGSFIELTPCNIFANIPSTNYKIIGTQIPQIATGMTNIYVGGGWATFKIETPTAANVVSNYIPADAIVIPTSATGDVQIILESSADLVNWTAASPGTYGASSATNRFFRVRAVHN